MEIEKIEITDIYPADYNPRIMSDEEYSKLNYSIDNFGLVDPIIINLNNNRIIGGHQRYDILMGDYIQKKENKELNLIKLGEIGWVFTDTDLKIESEDHEKALNIALNKISGDWDNPKLLSLLTDINPKTFDTGLIGFSDDEKDIISFKIEEEEVDKYSPGKNKIESGENVLFRIGKYKIKLPFSEYAFWKQQIEEESEEKEISVEALILDRLDLSKIIKKEENINEEEEEA